MGDEAENGDGRDIGREALEVLLLIYAFTMGLTIGAMQGDSIKSWAFGALATTYLVLIPVVLRRQLKAIPDDQLKRAAYWAAISAPFLTVATILLTR